MKDKNISNVLGVKFIVAGRLLGKMRANSSRIQIGAVPTQSVDKYIEFSKLHVYTLYGAFGFKIWVYRKI
jgi:ribosomal protein S3